MKFWYEAKAETVRTLLNAGHSLEDKCGADFTALGYSLPNITDPNIIEVFENSEFDFTVKSDSHLSNAAFGFLPQTIEFLLKKGASINKVSGKSGITPFLTACSYGQSVDILKALVRNGANIHHRAKTGKNCLYNVVSSNGRPEMIEYVLGLGLSGDFSKCETCNPVIAEYAYGWLAYSSSGGGKTIPRKESILEQLIEYGFDINDYKLKDGRVTFRPAIFHAIDNQDKDLVKWLLKRGVNPNFIIEGETLSPLGRAISPGRGFSESKPDLDIISLLVFHGAELNTTKGGYWDTPLTAKMDEKYYPDLANHLIDLGADIEFRNELGKTPLLYAAAMGYFNAFEFLLAKGANLHAIDTDGRNVLHLASMDNSLETVKKLSESGVDPKQLDKFGFSSLHLASLYTDNPLIIRYIARMSMDINAKAETKYQNPPLHLAIWNARYNSIANELIKFGADVNLRNAAGLTPLHVAAITCGDRDWKSGYPKTVSIMKILIEKGAQINVLDKENNTPLHHATENCYHPKPVSLLFKNGANIRARNKHGETPIDLISKNNDLKESKIYWAMRDKLLQ